MLHILRLFFALCFISLLGLGHADLFEYIRFQGNAKIKGYWWTRIEDCPVTSDDRLRQLTRQFYNKMETEIRKEERKRGGEVSHPPVVSGLFDGRRCIFASTAMRFGPPPGRMKHTVPIELQLSWTGHCFGLADAQRSTAPCPNPPPPKHIHPNVYKTPADKARDRGYSYSKYHVNPEHYRSPVGWAPSHPNPADPSQQWTGKQPYQSEHRHRGHCAEVIAIHRYAKEYPLYWQRNRWRWSIATYGRETQEDTGLPKPRDPCARRRDGDTNLVPGEFSCQCLLKHMGIRRVPVAEARESSTRLPSPKRAPSGSQMSSKRPRARRHPSTVARSSRPGSTSSSESGEMRETRISRQGSIPPKSRSKAPSTPESGEVGEARPSRQGSISSKPRSKTPSTPESGEITGQKERKRRKTER